ncbi:helix-turn-helix transcriptional regulator [bacterium]|nr:helix-turn-helix transcriptional regulator [bacterium]
MRQYLVSLRNEHGYSQQDVADKLNISRQYYQMIETGERQKKMDISLASGIATLYGISVMDVENFEKAIS